MLEESRAKGRMVREEKEQKDLKGRAGFRKDSEVNQAPKVAKGFAIHLTWVLAKQRDLNVIGDSMSALYAMRPMRTSIARRRTDRFKISRVQRVRPMNV